MLLIIGHHYVVNSGLNLMAYGDIFSWRSQFLLHLGGYGKTGINCFVLLSSYFLFNRNFSLIRPLRLFAQWKTYEIFHFVLFLISSSYERLTFKRLFELIMPFTHIDSNFMSCFLIFQFFIPFLSQMINQLTQKSHLLFLLLTVFLYSVMGSVPGIHITFNYVSWFSILYFIGAYLRRFPPRWIECQRVCIVMFIISLSLSVFSILLGSLLTMRLHLIVVYSMLQDSHKILALTNAVTSFLVFRNLRLGHTPAINWIAASVFGVFLFHASSDAMRRFLWQDVAHCQEWFNTPLLPLHAVLTIIGVFMVGLIIDKIRAACVACMMSSSLPAIRQIKCWLNGNH